MLVHTVAPLRIYLYLLVDDREALRVSKIFQIARSNVATSTVDMV